jgi:transposase
LGLNEVQVQTSRREKKGIDIERRLFRMKAIERTFAPLGHNRRLSKDCEALPLDGSAFVYVSTIRLMLKRLIKPKPAKRQFHAL